MTHIILNRVAQSKAGTYGTLILNHIPLCVTLELPWKDNEQDISCIPNGVYGCSRYTSERRGKVWKVHDVPNRTDILFHKGNYISEILGCILVGRAFTSKGIAYSRDALAELNKKLPDSFALSIIGGNYV
ncbi:hypothetical protein KAR91_59880 [Candidatus Pacearchaeota archaeon]|nr:hypothetical protein [Candidatus Pacearchaeota archaeon]